MTEAGRANDRASSREDELTSSISQNAQEAALAEFAALRNEIDNRVTLQHQIVLLQVTASGAVFSIVVANLKLASITLFVPLISYLFAAHYASLDKAIVNSANYIRLELNRRLDGRLGYERWLWRLTSGALDRGDTRTKNELGTQTNSGVRKSKAYDYVRQRRRWINPLYLTFPGIAIFGLISGLLLNYYNLAYGIVSTTKPILIGEIFLSVLDVVAIISAFRTVAEVASNHRDTALEETIDGGNAQS